MDLPQACMVVDRTHSKSKYLLRMACLFGPIVIGTVASSRGFVNDKHLASPKKIMKFAKQASLALYIHNKSFGIDSGLIDIIVGTKCRDLGLRRRALELLRTSSRVEDDRLLRCHSYRFGRAWVRVGGICL